MSRIPDFIIYVSTACTRVIHTVIVYTLDLRILLIDSAESHPKSSEGMHSDFLIVSWTSSYLTHNDSSGLNTYILWRDIFLSRNGVQRVNLIGCTKRAGCMLCLEVEIICECQLFQPFCNPDAPPAPFYAYPLPKLLQQSTSSLSMHQEHGSELLASHTRLCW